MPLGLFRSVYSLLKSVHIACAMLTITGFALRGFWMWTSSALLAQRITRILPHVIDTVFLLSGILMLVLASRNPFTESWLNAKFAGLVIYILLGTIALRRGPTLAVRAIAFFGALLVFAYIVGVALARSPASWAAA